MRSVLYWLIAHAQAVVTALAAVAAGFSGLSSFLIWRVQRTNLLESVRPELVLLGWTRKDNVITFSLLKNVGRGVALGVNLGAGEFSFTGDYLVRGIEHPIIGVDDEIPVPDVCIGVAFKNPDWEMVTVPLVLTSIDTRGNLYTTRYDILVLGSGGTWPGQLADGVAALRTTTMASAWRLRFRDRRARVRFRLRKFWKRLRHKPS